MIGIKAIASHVPPNFIDNIEQAQAFGETEEFIKNKIGAIRLPRKEEHQETSDLALLAVQALFKKCPELNKGGIDALVVVTQNPDGEGLPHTAAILQNKLGLSVTVAAFDVSLGCSGYVYGLFILKGFLEASGLSNGILVTADPYSKILASGDRVTNLLFGDAATATWLGKSPLWCLDAVAYGTDGLGADYLKVDQHRLQMNGRRVYNFASNQVEPHIKQLLERENLSPADIDLFCLHQGSAAILDGIAKHFGDLSERFVKDMTNTGNTVSSSIPLLLETRVLSGGLNRILISGFGVGFSWATAIISKVHKEDTHFD
ncbi:MAG: ketoacyl-ACP synthase III [Gallionellaceae bacterium]